MLLAMTVCKGATEWRGTGLFSQMQQTELVQGTDQTRAPKCPVPLFRNIWNIRNYKFRSEAEIFGNIRVPMGEKPLQPYPGLKQGTSWSGVMCEESNSLHIEK